LDSIVARALVVAEFFDSIGQSLTSQPRIGVVRFVLEPGIRRTMRLPACVAGWLANRYLLNATIH
jgi:hypothetical protein